jgi:hypothetical protein
VRWIVDEQPLPFYMEEIGPVSGCQILHRQDFFGRARGNNAARKQNHVIGHLSFSQIVGRHDDGAPRLSLVVDDIVDGLSGGQVQPGQWLIEE